MRVSLRVVATLLLGAVGGYIFYRLRMPLAWMLGPMMICIVASLLRAPLFVPNWLSTPMIAIVGVMLGSGFSPAMFHDGGRYLLTIGGLVLFMIVGGLITVVFLRRVAGYDLPTAYFSGMPGGLAEMILAGESKGGDGRRIALMHSSRVFIVVFCLPAIIALMGYDATASVTRPSFSSLLDTTLAAWLWLVACITAGVLLGRLVRLPAPMMVGPMLLSALVHGLGLTDFRAPAELVVIAQIVLGSSVGARFAGVRPAEVLRVIGYSAACNGLMLAVTVLFALAVGAASGMGILPILLAYSPGGLTEMSLMGLALNVETAFVVSHHIFRVLLVMLSASAVFAAVDAWGKRGKKS